MKPLHIMCDLETLSTTPRALVLSIGLVFFNAEKILGEEYFVLDIDEQRDGLKREISTSTMQWWQNQSDAARTVLTQTDRSNVPYTLGMLAGVIMKYKKAYGGLAGFWGNGAAFDNVVLGSLYDDYKFPRPWSYKEDRCFRTARAAADAAGIVYPPVDTGIAHNALDDARWQAISLMNINKLMHAAPGVFLGPP